MAKQRQVFPTDRIPHMWAHQSQVSARNPGGNLYFNGRTIYSYGGHFPLATLAPDCYAKAAGAPVVFVNVERRSNTTAKHQRAVSYAIPRDWRRIPVDGLAQHATGMTIGHALQESFELASESAATHRGIARDTRAALLAQVGRILADLRFVLGVEAARKDATAYNRKAARRMLRTLPADVPSIPQDASRKDAASIAQTFAGAALKPRYVREVASEWPRMRGLADDAAEYMARPEESGGHSGEMALNCIISVEHCTAKIRHACKVAGLKLPAGFAALESKIKPMRAAAEDRKAREDRADCLRRYADSIADARIAAGENSITWARHCAGRARVAARGLAYGDTPQEAAGRAAELAELEAYIERMTAAALPERFAALEAQARDALAAESALSSARRVAHGAPEYADRLANLARDVDALRVRCEAEAIAAWRNGGTAHGLPRGDSALLRLSDDRATIETSWGADVPASIAPMVWTAVNACRDAGTAHDFPRDDAPRLGAFTLDRIEADGGIVAGCHRIAFAELELIARTLGYNE